MADIQEKIMKSLASLVPADAKEKVSSAVADILNGLHEEYETKYNTMLEEAYEKMSAENEENVQKAVQSYDEAYKIIEELRKRDEIKENEMNNHMMEQFEDAYAVIKEERSKNEEIGQRLYETYSEKLNEIQTFMVNKVDAFLSQQGDKYYEMAKEEILNDPFLAEHKVAFDKVIHLVNDFVDEEEHEMNTSSKIHSLNENLERSSKEKRLLEGKIMRLESDNVKLNEVATKSQTLLEEQMQNEEKEWVSRSKNAEGRGDVVTDTEVHVIKEDTSEETTSDDVITEHSKSVDESSDLYSQWQHLSGLKDE